VSSFQCPKKFHLLESFFGSSHLLVHQNIIPKKMKHLTMTTITNSSSSQL
ncbi:AAEL001107-PA, partial [Aedes aegypti]